MELSHTGTHQQNNDGSYETVNIDEAEQAQPDSIHVVSIKEMLHQLHPITEECSIYRVSKRLHNINHKAYTPQAISIGPFHHGRQELMAMEELKLRFLNGYLRRVKMGVEAAFEIARGWEVRARKCYAEPISMNSHDFVEMMLVDGCFMVEFMIMNDDKFPGTQTELSCTLFQAIRTDIFCDLIMLENQLPFFILECLFDKCSISTPFLYFIRKFCTNWYIGAHEISYEVSTRKANHLVDLLSFYYVLPTVTKKTDKEWECPPTATELWEAGVEFEKATDSENITNIRFEDGILKIPPLNIQDAFETYVRNLMAYEHYNVGYDKRCVIQYASFLDELISTEKDVSLLVKAGIIINNIGGNNEGISKLFNDVCKDVNVACDFNYYNDISVALRKYCNTRWHQWKASLRRDYFNTPWAFISFIAATILIVFTVVQTIYTVKSYYK